MVCKDYRHLFRCQTAILVTFQYYVIVGFQILDDLLYFKVNFSELFLRLHSLDGLPA